LLKFGWRQSSKISNEISLILNNKCIYLKEKRNV
jgi:hypothetical protein